MPYYYLGGLISPLELDKSPEISWREFVDLLELNLADHDLQQMRAVLRYFDIENLRLYLRGAPLNRHGRLQKKDFDSLFIESEHLEAWWESFLEKQGQKDKTASLVNELQYEYFALVTREDDAAAYVLKKLWKSHWMAAYVRLEMKKRENMLVSEPGALDDQVTLWLQEFEEGLGSYELESLKNIWQPSGNKLEEIAKNYVQWQLDFFSEELENPFELEALLSYLIQLAWLERWQEKNSPSAFSPKLSANEALNTLKAEMTMQATPKNG